MEHDAAIDFGSPERRSISDRRQPSLASQLCGGFGRNRRREARRRADRDGYYIDWYDQRLLGIALGVFALSCADAFMTLNLLQLGATEFNPFMALLLEISDHVFVYTKLAVTAVGVVFLVMHCNFTVFGTVSVSHVLYMFLLWYGLLFAYQVLLLSYASSAPPTLY